MSDSLNISFTFNLSIKVRNYIQLINSLSVNEIRLFKVDSKLYPRKAATEDLLRRGARVEGQDDEIVPEAAALAAQAQTNDIALIVLGHAGGEGADRMGDEFYLTTLEKQLVKDVTDAYHAVGKKAVVVLNIPGAIEMESWKNIPDAIVCAFQGGDQMGNALADVLTGKVNPSGKLSVTFAKDLMDYPSSNNFPIKNKDQEVSGMAAGGARFRFKDEMTNEGEKDIDYCIYEEGIYVGYRYFDTFGIDVTYPFGYGLSYTTFEYSEPKIEMKENDFVVSVTVQNTGDCDGREIVQLYVAAPKGKLDKPKRELRGFAKTKNLMPGEKQTLTMVVKPSDLASFNSAASQWETDKGVYEFMVGASLNDIKANLQGTVKKAYTKKVNNALKPEVTINELKSK